MLLPYRDNPFPFSCARFFSFFIESFPACGTVNFFQMWWDPLVDGLPSVGIPGLLPGNTIKDDIKVRGHLARF